MRLAVSLNQVGGSVGCWKLCTLVPGQREPSILCAGSWDTSTAPALTQGPFFQLSTPALASQALESRLSQAPGAGAVGAQAAAGPPPSLSSWAKSAVLTAAGLQQRRRCRDPAPLLRAGAALCPHPRPDGHLLAAARSPRRVDPTGRRR